QVGLHLTGVNRHDSASGLQFDDHRFIDNKIEKVFADNLRSVPDLDQFLTFNTIVGVLQLDNQRPAVNALHEPAPELRMHRQGGLQNFLNQTMSFEAHRRITSNRRSAACGYLRHVERNLTRKRAFKHRRCAEKPKPPASSEGKSRGNSHKKAKKLFEMFCALLWLLSYFAWAFT